MTNCRSEIVEERRGGVGGGDIQKRDEWLLDFGFLHAARQGFVSGFVFPYIHPRLIKGKYGLILRLLLLLLVKQLIDMFTKFQV